MNYNEKISDLCIIFHFHRSESTMKKKTATTVFSIVISLCIIFSAVTAVRAKKIKSLEPGAESTAYFADKSVHQLVKDLNYFKDFDNVNGELVFTLNNKISADDAEYCSKVMKSPLYSDFAKIALLDVCREKEIKLDKTVMSKLITKKSLDSDLRSYIIGYCAYQDKDYCDELIKIASDKNDDLSYYALNRLSFVDKSQAQTIAKEIISEYDGTYSDRMKNAMMIESERLEESGDKEAVSEFNIFSSKITEGQKNN